MGLPPLQSSSHCKGQRKQNPEIGETEEQWTGDYVFEAELGLNYASDNGTTLRAATFYDGISSDHESFGVNLSLDMKF